MREHYFTSLAQAALLALFVLAACTGKDEALGDRSPAGASPICTISCAGAGAPGEGGESSSGRSGSSSGGGRSPLGGAAGSASGEAGGDSTPGGEGGSAGGGPVDPRLEELTLCNRLSNVSQSSTSVATAFERLVYRDCRVNWLSDLYLDFHPNKRDDYLNALVPWNLRFWGCQAQPVGDFPLVFGTPPLSRGDFQLVIDYYVQAANKAFDLTTKEETEMRGALERLAAPLLVSDSSEPSQPNCDEMNAGGAGGLSGTGGAPASAGQGGMP